jgi:two-component system, sensor histidine kinase
VLIERTKIDYKQGPRLQVPRACASRLRQALIVRPVTALRRKTRNSSSLKSIPGIDHSAAAQSHLDVAERTKAEWRQACEAAEDASRAKSRFLASMSHEIRTPMNGILGLTSLLSETEQTSEQQTYIRAIDQSARSLLSLIDEILDFSKIEAGKLKLAAEPFSLRSCIAGAVALLEPMAFAKGITLLSEIASDVPEYAIGDETRVRQILLNLMSNAVKFTDRGLVEVVVNRSTELAPRQNFSGYEITVRDTGIGFSAETMKRLFAEFEQADGVDARRHGGSGLGLVISKRLARAMGGDIRAKGVLGKGAVFSATMRLKDAQPGISQAFTLLRHSSDDIGVQKRRKPRVLIAEDNDINALLTRRVSERAGCIAIAVKCGRSAVDAVRQSLESSDAPFDLILMDISMPDMDGFEATREIRRLYRERGIADADVPGIIAVTASAYAEDRKKCLDSGMDDYLAKPFDAAQLKSVIGRWLPRLAAANTTAA